MKQNGFGLKIIIIVAVAAVAVIALIFGIKKCRSHPQDTSEKETAASQEDSDGSSEEAESITENESSPESESPVEEEVSAESETSPEAEESLEPEASTEEEALTETETSIEEEASAEPEPFTLPSLESENPIYEMPSFTEDPLSAEEYYEQNATVMSVLDAESSDKILTEKEAVQFFNERGFSDYEVKYDSAIDGSFIGEREASADSSEKHPFYITSYISKGEIFWTIYYMNGEVIANPISYNNTNTADKAADTVLSETDHLTSYDNELNEFYVTVPNETTVIVKTVKTIDAEFLDTLTAEEIEKL